MSIMRAMCLDRDEPGPMPADGGYFTGVPLSNNFFGAQLGDFGGTTA